MRASEERRGNARTNVRTTKVRKSQQVTVHNSNRTEKGEEVKNTRL